MPFDATDSDAPNIPSLHLPLHLEHALMRAGVFNTEALAWMTEADLLRRGVTIGELQELRAELIARNITWADPEQLELPSKRVAEHALADEERNVVEQAELGFEYRH
jgi:hypothetical protein